MEIVYNLVVGVADGAITSDGERSCANPAGVTIVRAISSVG